MGLKKGWLQEVENYISTLEEDLDYLAKENGQLRAEIERLRMALREIKSLSRGDPDRIMSGIHNRAEGALDNDD